MGTGEGNSNRLSKNSIRLSADRLYSRSANTLIIASQIASIGYDVRSSPFASSVIIAEVVFNNLT